MSQLNLIFYNPKYREFILFDNFSSQFIIIITHE